MTDPDPFCVLDASVAIDLMNGDIVLEFDRLPLNAGIPDVVLEEIVVDEEKIKGLMYEIIEFTGEEVIEAASLGAEYRNVSKPDIFAFLAAREKSAFLLTGDASLRQLAATKDVTVHGMLWVLDELVEAELLVPLRAAKVLRDILDLGSFLPKTGCESRFRDWGAPEEYWLVLD